MEIWSSHDVEDLKPAVVSIRVIARTLLECVADTFDHFVLEIGHTWDAHRCCLTNANRSPLPQLRLALSRHQTALTGKGGSGTYSLLCISFQPAVEEALLHLFSTPRALETCHILPRGSSCLAHYAPSRSPAVMSLPPRRADFRQHAREVRGEAFRIS